MYGPRLPSLKETIVRTESFAAGINLAGQLPAARPKLTSRDRRMLHEDEHGCDLKGGFLTGSNKYSLWPNPSHSLFLETTFFFLNKVVLEHSYPESNTNRHCHSHSVMAEFSIFDRDHLPANRDESLLALHTRHSSDPSSEAHR